MLLRRNPALAERPWFRWAGGSLKLPITDEAFRKVGLAVLAFVLAFDIGIYNYYRGSVLTGLPRWPRQLGGTPFHAFARHSFDRRQRALSHLC